MNEKGLLLFLIGGACGFILATVGALLIILWDVLTARGSR